jgi:6,7-dimethyl-8-ribityllumazine synthase
MLGVGNLSVPVDIFAHAAHSHFMSTALLPKPRVFGQKVRICIVASKYNETYTDALVENTIAELRILTPMARIDLIRVPGAFEIPVVVANLLDRERFQCIIALGLILRGHTQHADLVAQSVTDSLQKLATQHLVPVINEVLLVDDEAQARARCLEGEINRGQEAARAATSITEVFASIEKTMPRNENKNKQ